MLNNDAANTFLTGHYRGTQDIRMFKMIGLPIKTDTRLSMPSSPSNVCQINGPNAIQLRTNLTLKYDVAGKNNNDTFLLPINCNPGGLIIYEGAESENRVELEYERTEIDKIDIMLEYFDSSVPIGGDGGLNGYDSNFVFKLY